MKSLLNPKKYKQCFVFVIVASLVISLMNPMSVDATSDTQSSEEVEASDIESDNVIESEEDNSDDSDSTSDESGNTIEESGGETEDSSGEDITEDSTEGSDGETESSGEETKDDGEGTEGSGGETEDSDKETSKEETDTSDKEDSDTDLDEGSTEIEGGVSTPSNATTVSGNDIGTIEDETAENDIEAQAYSGGIATIVGLFGVDNVAVDEENNSVTLLNDINATGYMVITEDITIDLNGHTINIDVGDSTKNFLTVSYSNFNLIGGVVNISNGDNIISISSGANINVQDCTFNQTNCSRVIFSLGNLTLDNCNIENSSGKGNGGALFIRGGSACIRDCTIRNNTANGNGGGISTDQGATIEICGNTLFSGNRATGNGNAIYSNGSTIILKDECNIDKANIWVSSDSLLQDQRVQVATLQELIDDTPVGGTLTLLKDYLNQASVVISKDITIELNGHTIEGAFTSSEYELINVNGANVTISGPGNIKQLSGVSTLYRVIYAYNGSSLTLKDINADANSNRFVFVENSELNVNNCSIENCGSKSTSGGAVISIGSTVTIEDTSISNCVSAEGPAIRALSNSIINVGSTGFTNNKSMVYLTSSGHGGAVYCVDSELNIYGNSQFIGNRASNTLNNYGKYGIGGAIYSDSKITIADNTVFDDNVAWFGGAIWCSDEIIITGGTFKNNIAKIGGAICGSNIDISGDTSINNNAATWGGGICSGPLNTWSNDEVNKEGYVKLSGNVTIENNTAIRVSELTRPSEYVWNDDLRGQGGGIWAHDLVIDGNVSIINNNCGQYGGGIYSRHSVQVSAGTISGNTAQLGGGIFLFNEGFIQGSPLNPIRIENNYAKDDTTRHGFAGGGIFVEHKVDSTVQGPYGASLHINGVVITDNIAEGLGRGWGGGGAIGGCGEAMVHAYSGQGAAIYNNHSPNTDSIMSQAQDIRLDGKGTITTQGLGRTTIAWDGVGGGLAGQENTWTHVSIDSGNMEMNGMRLTATMSESDIQLAKTIAGVYMTGNKSGSSGGAIGGNGEIKLGMPVQEVTAQKIWDDNNNEYGERPLTLSVTLNRKGKVAVDGKLEDVDEVIDTQVITSNDNWRYTWYDLEELDDSNLPWEYYVDEIDTTEDMKNYKKKVVGTNIYNTYTKISFKVQKIWEDNNDVDNIRPEKIEIEVYRNNVLWDTIELSDDNNWEYTFEKVDKFDENDKEYKYTVQEKEVPDGYTASIKGFEITNSHTPVERTNFTVKKVWNDENDIDKLRPSSVTVEVYRNTELYDTIELNENNSWRKEYTNIPKTDIHGNEYVYSVKEVQLPDGYTQSINGTTITNTHIHIDKINIDVNKVWDDGNDADGVRPEKVTFALLRDGVQIDTVELSEDNNWKHTFEDLDKTDERKHEYKYTIKELNVPDYYTDSTNGYTITNKHTPIEKINITVQKVWDDELDIDGLRPNSVTIEVYQNDKLYNTVVLNEGNNWKKEYTDLPKTDLHNVEYKYTVKEVDKIDGYTSSTNGTVITNTHVHIPKIDIPVSKVWDDQDDIDGIRPDKVVIELLRDGVHIDEIELSEDNNWEYTFKDLDKIDITRHEYKYTIKEKDVPNGYVSAIKDYTVTNRHTPKDTPKTTFTIKKTWDDANDQDKIRPEQIEVTVYRNGLWYDTIILSKDNGWSYTYTDIDKEDKDGNEYVYTVDEPVLPEGYTSSINGYTITNTHKPKEYIGFTVRKIWDDHNDQFNQRPKSITVEVFGINGLFDTIVLSSDNNWQHEYKNLDKYDENGKENKYFVREQSIPDGYTAYVKDYDIYNVYIGKTEPEKTRFLVQKIWDDHNNKDGIRPMQIEVEVYRNNRLFDTVILSDANNWRKEYVDLDAQDDLGNKYTYSVKEKTQLYGYTTVINGFVITNKHVPKEDEHPEIPKTSFTVYKIWDDEDNKDNIRPSSIDIEVLRNEVVWDTITLNSNNAWSYSYINIDKQDSNGKDYEYTVREVNVPNGYTASIVGFKVTNKHIPELPPDDPYKQEEPYKPDEPPKYEDTPKTADETDMVTPFVTMITSLILLIILEIKRRRDK